MEYTDEKILNIKYNAEKNLLEIGQADKGEFVRKNKFILGITGLTVSLIIVNMVLLAKFFELLQAI